MVFGFAGSLQLHYKGNAGGVFQQSDQGLAIGVFGAVFHAQAEGADRAFAAGHLLDGGDLHIFLGHDPQDGRQGQLRGAFQVEGVMGCRFVNHTLQYSQEKQRAHP